MWNKNFGATDDLDRNEYEKTNRHLVGEGNACYSSLTGHEEKFPRVDTYK